MVWDEEGAKGQGRGAGNPANDGFDNGLERAEPPVLALPGHRPEDELLGDEGHEDEPGEHHEQPDPVHLQPPRLQREKQGMGM